MLSKGMIGLAGSVLLATLIGCATNMTPWESGDVASARKVLIAGEDTAFKRDVVTKLVEKLGTQGWYFQVVGLDRLASADTQPFGAVLLLCGYRAGRLDERVTSYLARDPADRRVIVFYTRGTEDPMPARSKPDLRVDAVSSASRSDRVEQRAAELAALIEARF